MVLPICSNYGYGTGVLVGNLFITAAHVIEECKNPQIYLNGIFIDLDSSRKVIFRNDKNETTDDGNGYDENGYDLAVYLIPEKRSTLNLFPYIPNAGEELDSISHIPMKGNAFVAIGMKDNSSSEPFSTIECKVTVSNIICGNWYGGITSKILKSGASGNPVFYNGQVAGILTMGNVSDTESPTAKDFPLNFCAFLSSKSILSIIKELGFADFL